MQFAFGLEWEYYMTLHPALSVCWSIGWSIHPSICHTLLFLGIWGLWPHYPCPSDQETSNTTPAHPHVTGVAMYLWGFTRPSIIYFNLSKVRDIIPIFISKLHSCIAVGAMRISDKWSFFSSFFPENRLQLQFFWKLMSKSFEWQ